MRISLTLTAAELDLSEEWREHAARAEQLARASGDARNIGRALLIGTFGARDDMPGQRVLHTEALRLLRLAGDLQWVCNALVFLSISGGLEADDPGEARSLSEEAMAIAEQLGSSWHSRLLWANHGVTLYLLGEVDGAEDFSRRALLTSRRIGIQVGTTAWIIFVLACCATSRGDAVRGAQLTGAHDALVESLSETGQGYWSPMELAMRSNNRATLREALGETEYERRLAVGRELNLDRLVDYALRRVDV